MASSRVTGRLTIEWKLITGDADDPDSFDWKLSQAGDARLDDDQIETLLKEIIERI